MAEPSTEAEGPVDSAARTSSGFDRVAVAVVLAQQVRHRKRKKSVDSESEGPLEAPVVARAAPGKREKPKKPKTEKGPVPERDQRRGSSR